MLKHEVESSNISHVGYKPGTLFIKFKSGGAYQYHNAPYDLFDGLMKSSSAGRYFHAHIRGKLRYERMAKDPFVRASDNVRYGRRATDAPTPTPTPTAVLRRRATDRQPEAA